MTEVDTGCLQSICHAVHTVCVRERRVRLCFSSCATGPLLTSVKQKLISEPLVYLTSPHGYMKEKQSLTRAQTLHQPLTIRRLCTSYTECDKLVKLKQINKIYII